MSQTFRHALNLLDRTFRSKPLAFLLAAWVTGILLAHSWPVQLSTAGSLGLVLVLLALALRPRWAALAFLLLSLICLGAARTGIALTPPRGDISEWVGRYVAVEGTIDSQPVVACNRWRCIIRCRSVTSRGRTTSTQGRLRLSTVQLPKNAEVGHLIRVYGIPERPSPARNPGGFSMASWLAQHGVFAVMNAKPRAIVDLHSSESNWRRVTARLRHRIAQSNRQAISNPEAAALINSFLFGDLDQDDDRQWGAMEERFRRAGLSHVLVVSGAQVALLFGMLALWRRWVLGPYQGSVFGLRLVPRAAGAFSFRRALAIGLSIVVPFALLAGLGPSVLRATLVVGIFFLARCLDREVDPENSLAAAALLLLVVNPLTLYDIGFKLSFAAVWGLLRWTAIIARVLEQRPQKSQNSTDEPVPDDTLGRRSGLVALTIAATPAAILAIAPIIAYHFHRFTTVSILANLPVCLMAAMLLPLGLVTSLVNLAISFGSAPSFVVLAANGPTALLAQALNSTVTFFALPSWATTPVFPPHLAELVLYYSLLTVGSVPGFRKRLSIAMACVGLAVLVLANAMWWRPARSVSVATLTFIDVGQGDACLIRLPEGSTVLVDGGGSPRAPCEPEDCSQVRAGKMADSLRMDCLDVGRDILAEYLRRERVGRIDLVVLTHPHDDHLWGLNAVLDPEAGFNVGAVLDACRSVATTAYDEWRQLLDERGLSPIVARRGMQLALGSARLEVLHPTDRFLQGTRSDENNNSVVMRLDVGGRRVLLTGDAEAAAEAAMAGLDLRADVLKVGHHGSASSSNDAWLDGVRPNIAVISCGRNNLFGHPSASTLARLQRRDTRVFRTDRHGAVTVELRPSEVAVRTMLHP